MAFRILLVAVLSALVSVSVVLALRIMANNTAEGKREAAREAVDHELERMVERYDARPDAKTLERGFRRFPGAKGGYVSAGLRDWNPSAQLDFRELRAREEALKMSRAKNGPAVFVTEGERGGPIVVGMAPLSSGDYAWSLRHIVVFRGTARARAVHLVLAIASVAVVLVALHTLFVFRRGVRSIVGSLGALRGDLAAPVDRPKMRELGEIAGGIASLASGLEAARKEQDELRRELEAHERLAALGRVVAGVAHEVRNPLTAIKLPVDLALERPSLPPDLRADLSGIAEEIKRLDVLVSDLLVVSGQRIGPREQTKLESLIEARVALLSPWAAQHQVTVVSRGAAVADVDPAGIARVLDNLLRNAVEASPRGKPIDVEIAEEGEYADVTVVDRGAGVADDCQSRLFEPFFSTRPKGTGLGLALSRAVAAAHRGTLAYERVGGTTRFTLRVPRSVPPPSA